VVKIVTFGLMAGALSVLIISAIFTPETLPKMSVCSFRVMTGRPCPGCGLTRGFCCISHARFGEAIYYNPFSFVFYAGTLFLLFWPFLAWRFPKLKQWGRDTNLLMYAIPGLIVAMFFWGAYRMAYGPFV
jgi:hypothetical protein